MLKLFKRYYGKLTLATVLFVIKQSPAMIFPIIIANVIDLAMKRPENFYNMILLNVGFIVALLLINIPCNYVFTKYYSIAMRSVEAGLRGALVRKLQQLSINYHKEMESGRIQSKIMRDVENIQNFALQIYMGVLTISVNMIIALSVVVTKNLVVFSFSLYVYRYRLYWQVF